MIIGVFFHQSFALFETKENFNLIEGQVQESGDLYFAYYVNDEISLDVPTKDSGLTLSSKSSCTNGVTILWDNEKWEARLSYANYQKERTGRVKCSLYFEKPENGKNMMVAMERMTLTTNSANLLTLEESTNDNPPPSDNPDDPPPDNPPDNPDVPDIPPDPGVEINATYTQKGKYSETLKKVIFETAKSPIEGALEVVDFSVNQDESVLGYYVANEDQSEVTLHIQADGKIKMNPNGSYYFWTRSSYDTPEYTFEGIENIDTSETTNMAHMFDWNKQITSLDLSNFDTRNVTDMSGMFYNTNLTSLNVSSFDTRNVTDMSGMFWNASGLTRLDVSNFNTSKVTDMSGMFSGLYSLTSLDLSSFDTSNVTDMSSMFFGLSGLTSIDLRPLNTSKVTDMSSMFYGMRGLTSIDLSPLNTSNVTNMRLMFSRMNGLTSMDLRSFDTRNVTNMESMFEDMAILTSLDLSSWDTSNVTNMKRMFSKTSKLANLTYGNTFIHKEGADINYMFDSDCPANKPTHESWSSVTW